MPRYVLVFNAGSSSLKYRLLDPETGQQAASGQVERIGEDGDGQLIHHGSAAEPRRVTARFPDHESALAAILEAFRQDGPDLGACALAAVGHRIVHGATRFTEPTVLDDAVLDQIRELNPLAPLHNPAGLAGVEVARRAFPHLPHIAVFDTAFHHTLPPAAHTYAVPQEWRDRYSVRRYGFHGTSHQYVARRAAALLALPVEHAHLITLHLGNGASACAIENGRSIETSMGLTPLEGLVMGTRSGDLDPALPAYLHRIAGLQPEQTDHALNHDSGLLALTGHNDLRDIENAASTGDARAQLALDIYCHRIRKYIGAYYAVLGRVDALVFTAGIGEHSPEIRSRCLAGLEPLGLAIDESLNHANTSDDRFISPPTTRIPVLVIPTDEETEIARQALTVIDA
jgi:acetate kinase